MKLEEYLIIAIVIALGLLLFIIEQKYPVQLDKFKEFLVRCGALTKIGFLHILEIALKTIDQIHLVIMLIGTIISGFATVNLFILSSEIDKAIKDGKVGSSPLALINDQDWTLLMSVLPTSFAICASIIFFFALALFIISLKISYYASKSRAQEKLQEEIRNMLDKQSH
jgi:hypothetical protein